MIEKRLNLSSSDVKSNRIENMNFLKAPTLKEGYNLLFDHPIKI